ncbi:MAG TPA: hypothetical protein VLA75_08400, partial [Thermoanaerobaculia bacterium]|nr:hypothetical protein [Thermoanaerobaculia bacterium]
MAPSKDWSPAPDLGPDSRGRLAGLVPGSPPALFATATWVGWGLLTGLAAVFAARDHRRAR